MFCITNFEFTDWQGNVHPFVITLDCNVQAGLTPPYVPSPVGDATDGSFYRIDITDPNNPKVISKGGTVYLFPPLSNPFANNHIPTTQPCCYSALSNENNYDARFTAMTDTNGTSISLSGSSQSYTMTDTLGRQYVITPSGITYEDSNGKLQDISVGISDSGTDVTNVLPVTCTYNGPVPPTNSLAGCTALPAPGKTSYQASIVFPAADVNSNKRTTTLDLDQQGRITTITYPTGGYTRYDYTETTVQSWSTLTTIYYPIQEVSHRYECDSSGGDCTPSTENVTTYTPTIAINNSTQQPYNSAITVTDPLGNYAIHTFGAITAGQIAPKEIDLKKYDFSQKFFWEQTTTYQPPTSSGSLQIATDLYFPHTITTTLQDVTPAVSSSVTYTYDTYSAQFYRISNTPNISSVYIDNPIEVDESEFGGTVVKKTMEQWAAAGTFSSNSHILDRPISKTVSDQLKSLQNTTSYVYDGSSNTVGNFTKVTVSGTNASTAVTSYVRNGFGQVTGITDPLGHSTTISYDDKSGWANTTCQPAAGSSAYPTSVKNALSQTKSYKYNSCTGTIASVSGPNTGQTTSYTYDALQRVVKVLLPDGGGEEACYFDSAPTSSNQITSYKLQTAGATLPACSNSTATSAGSITTSTVLDGLGRTMQNLLLSDPQGTIYTDTAYDSDGRVESVSNPYRSPDEDTYGLTSKTFDGLGRVVSQTNPDNTTQTWGYAGNVVTFTDENLNQWERTSNAAGALVKVKEPNGTSSAPSMETDYAYDGLGNLWSVTQNGQSGSTARTRNFTYDGLSRLLCASNPENSTAVCPAASASLYTTGTTGYTYDNGGNLTQRMSPGLNGSSGTQAMEYCYDKLNRVALRYAYASNTSCTNTAGSIDVAAFAYDGGLLPGSLGTGISFTNATGQMTDEQEIYGGSLVSERIPYGFDLMGRMKTERQIPYTPASSAYTFNRTYDLLGNSRTSNNTATGITFTNTFDLASRLTNISSSLAASGSVTYPTNLYNVSSYGPAGVVQATYEGDPNNTGFFNLFRYYDKRMRLTSNELYPNNDGFGTATVAIVGGNATDTGRVYVSAGGTGGGYDYAIGNSASVVANGVAAAINHNGGSSVTASVAAGSYSAKDSSGHTLCLNGVVPNKTTPCAVLNLKSIVVGQYGNVALAVPTGSGVSFTSTPSNTTLIGGVGSPQGPTTAYVYTLGYTKNGNIGAVDDGYNGSWTYTYDTLNRLTAAAHNAYEMTGVVVTTGNPGTYNNQCWAYDDFGNRLYELYSNAMNPCPASSTNYSNAVQVNRSNQVTTVNGFTISRDSAGNITQDNLNNYLYDLEGRLCAVQNRSSGTATQYVYDAGGNRVAKGSLTGVNWPTGGSTCPIPTLSNGVGFKLAATYLYGAGGQVDTELDQPASGASVGSWHQNVYGAQGMTATYTGQNGTPPALYFSINDWLGTKRVELDTTGQAVAYWKSDPFGDYQNQVGSGTDAAENHFTGKERDFESGGAIAEAGNDYFGARYYASTMGRFLSPDWSAQAEPVPYAKLNDPQSLNLYAFVGNNPLTFIDPDGHFLHGTTGDTCTANAAGNGCSKGKDDSYQQFAAQQQSVGHTINNAISQASDVVSTYLVIPIAAVQLAEGAEGTPQEGAAEQELEAGAAEAGKAIETKAEAVGEEVSKGIAKISGGVGAKASDALKSIEKAQQRVRSGSDGGKRIIDSIQKSADRVRHALDRITKGDYDPHDWF